MGILTWLSNSAVLVFLECWPYAPSSDGVSGSVYQVVSFNMVGKVVLSFVVEVTMYSNFKVACGEFIYSWLDNSEAKA